MKLYNIALIFTLLSSTMGNVQENAALNYLDINGLYEVIDLQDESIDKKVIPEEVKEEIQTLITKFNVNGLELKEGIHSEQVLRFERFLIEKGYKDITEDYYFDSKTKELTVMYQQTNGLKPDGIVGPNTFQKVNEDMEVKYINIPEVELTFNKDIPAEDWIIINKSNNTLYHLKGNQIIERYPVATGKTLAHTPEGKFSVVVKTVNPAWGGAGIYTPVRGGAPNNPLGKRWMGLSISGGGVYGIHGNSDYGSIGKYISLGCIRMFNQDVESLYDLIDRGTPVWIGRETKLLEYGLLFQLPNQIIE